MDNPYKPPENMEYPQRPRFDYFGLFSGISLLIIAFSCILDALNLIIFNPIIEFDNQASFTIIYICFILMSFFLGRVSNEHN